MAIGVCKFAIAPVFSNALARRVRKDRNAGFSGPVTPCDERQLREPQSGGRLKPGADASSAPGARDHSVKFEPRRGDPDSSQSPDGADTRM